MAEVAKRVSESPESVSRAAPFQEDLAAEFFPEAWRAFQVALCAASIAAERATRSSLAAKVGAAVLEERGECPVASLAWERDVSLAMAHAALEKAAESVPVLEPLWFAVRRQALGMGSLLAQYAQKAKAAAAEKTVERERALADLGDSDKGPSDPA